ncbi:MAG: precorrin-2 dehydrogenase [Halanaerobiales bacterium]|nr:precorrin-2 dehydrogenase [Halanaerobiales bacterium]
MNPYPVNIDLTDRQVLVVGGGKVAWRKLKRLLRAGARITLVSPRVINRVAGLINSENITYCKRKFVPDDIKGCFMVIAATNDKQINKQIGELALAENKLVNVVDDAQLSNFTLPAIVERGDLLITIATGGNSPALAKEIRKKLEEYFGEEYANFLQVMGQLRPVIIDKVVAEEERREVFRKLANLELLALLAADKNAGIDKIKEVLQTELGCEFIIGGDVRIKA